MSDPVSGTSLVVAGGLMGAGMFGLVTGIDYGVVLSNNFLKCSNIAIYPLSIQ